MKISAFQNKTEELVAVILNRGNSAKMLKINMPGSSEKAKVYETSGQHDLYYLGEYKISDEIKVDPRSVTTLVFQP